MIKISSFTENDTFYFVEIDAADNRMVSCSCEDYRKSAWTCKHMFLVSIQNSIEMETLFVNIVFYLGDINKQINRILGVGLIAKNSQPVLTPRSLSQNAQIQSEEPTITQDDMEYTASRFFFFFFYIQDDIS